MRFLGRVFSEYIKASLINGSSFIIVEGMINTSLVVTFNKYKSLSKVAFFNDVGQVL